MRAKRVSPVIKVALDVITSFFKVEGGNRKCAPETKFPGGGGGEDSGVRNMALLSLGCLEAKFSETSFTHFKTYLTQNSHYYL